MSRANRANPFHHYASQDSKGMTAYEDKSKQVLGTIEKFKLDGLVIISGEGTQSRALKFSEMGVSIVGVTKTIDNDLNSTDVTFGFDSALVKATEVADELYSMLKGLLTLSYNAVPILRQSATKADPKALSKSLVPESV